jgi:hypothetical protein
VVRIGRSGGELLLVSGLASLLYVWMTWPLAAHPRSRIFGIGGDSTGTIASLWEDRHEGGYHILGAYHIDLLGAPFGWLQGSAPNVQVAFAAYPAYLVSGVVGEIAAYNLIVFSGFVLSFVAMYVLARRVDAARSVALWGGLVYTVFPWHLEKAQGHATFVHLEGFPLLVLAVLAWRERPDWIRAMFIALSTAILWTTAGYFGVVGSVAVVVLVPIAARSRRWTDGRSAVQAISIVAAAGIAVPIAIYGLTRVGGGDTGLAPARNVSELATYGAHWWEYVVPSYRNVLFGHAVGPWLLGRLHGSNFSETSLYVGWVTIVLAAAWIGRSIRHRQQLSDEERFLCIALPLLVFAGLLFSLPSPLPHTQLPTPSRLVWAAVPQFRVPSRFVVLVVTGLAVLAVLGLEAIRGQFASNAPGRLRPLIGTAIVIVVGIASFLELSTVPPATVTDVGTNPPEYAVVRATGRGVVAEYPLVSADEALNSEYLLRQRFHRHDLLNGAPPGSFADAVRAVVVDPSAPGVANSLATLGVTAVVVHPTSYPAVGAPTPPAGLGTRGYRLKGSFSDGATVWNVVAPPAPAIAVFEQGFGFSEPYGGQPTVRWMGSSKGIVEIYARRAGTYSTSFQVTSYGQPRALELRGARGSIRMRVPTTPRPFMLQVRVPAGRSSLRVSTSPGPQVIPDGRQVTVYVSNWDFHPAAHPRPNALVSVAGPVS